MGSGAEILRSMATGWSQGEGEEPRKAGGPVPRRALGKEATTLVVPREVTEETWVHEGTPRLGGSDPQARFQGEKARYVTGHLAEGTKKGYNIGWHQWCIFCGMRERSPFVLSEDRAGKRIDEEDLLDFVIHLFANMGRAEGTVKQRLFGIRAEHVVRGLGDPLLGRPRMWMAIKGARRIQGSRPRKLPVTATMMKWIGAQLDPEANPNDAVLWGAVCTGWFFLARAGEYLHSNGWDEKKVARGCDFRVQRSGVPTNSWKEADEVLLCFRSSKSDQEGQGATRSHYRSGEELCVVRALAHIAHHFPQRLGQGADGHRPLFRWEDGAPVTREQVQGVLEKAGVAQGLPAERMRTHSLRIGGATALYHIYHDTEIIKRYGRWSSDAFHSYLWEGSSASQDVAKKMAQDQTSLFVS